MEAQYFWPTTSSTLASLGALGDRDRGAARGGEYGPEPLPDEGAARGGMGARYWYARALGRRDSLSSPWRRFGEDAVFENARALQQ